MKTRRFTGHRPQVMGALLRPHCDVVDLKQQDFERAQAEPVNVDETPVCCI